jgi:hypothetical protein
MQITFDPPGADIYTRKSPENLKYAGTIPKATIFTAGSPIRHCQWPLNRDLNLKAVVAAQYNHGAALNFQPKMGLTL